MSQITPLHTAQKEAAALTNDQNDERNRRGALLLAAFALVLVLTMVTNLSLIVSHHDSTSLLLGVDAASALGMATATLLYKNSSKEEQSVVHRIQLEERNDNDIEMHSLNRARLRHEEQTVYHSKDPLCQA